MRPRPLVARVLLNLYAIHNNNFLRLVCHNLALVVWGLAVITF